MKKTVMPNFIKSLGYIKCYSSSSPRPVKNPRNFINTAVRKSAVDREDLTPYWKSEKDHISQGDQQSFYLQVFKDFTNHRKRTNRTVVFSYRPFPNVLKYKTLSDTCRRVQFICIRDLSKQLDIC